MFPLEQFYQLGSRYFSSSCRQKLEDQVNVGNTTKKELLLHNRLIVPKLCKGSLHNSLVSALIHSPLLASWPIVLSHVLILHPMSLRVCLYVKLVVHCGLIDRDLGKKRNQGDHKFYQKKIQGLSRCFTGLSSTFKDTKGACLCCLNWGSHEKSECALELRSRNRGGANGGLEGTIAPCRNILAPRRKMKNYFVGDFWHLQYPDSRILAPSSESQPPVGKFLTPPLSRKLYEVKMGSGAKSQKILRFLASETFEAPNFKAILTAKIYNAFHHFAQIIELIPSRRKLTKCRSLFTRWSASYYQQGEVGFYSTKLVFTLFVSQMRYSFTPILLTYCFQK